MKERLMKIIRQSNFIKRTLLAGLLLCFFGSLTYFGPKLIMLSALVIQIKCYSEIINLGYSWNKFPDIPYFRRLNWFFVLAANYFFYGEAFTQHFKAYLTRYRFLDLLATYHRFISFWLYFTCLVWFILSLARKHDIKQFKLLAWTHFLLIIIGFQSYMIVDNIFEGMIWFVLTIAVVVCNDIFGYIFGRLMGKTPLIEVSPRKTVEGFVGAAISTVVLGVILSHFLSQFPYFICPIKYVPVKSGIIMLSSCSPGYIFRLQTYSLMNSFIKFKTYPVVFHSLSLSLFGSLIAPFGGFFASGFKRAINIKDFGDVIPGHGGLMDRFDCVYLMATFVNVYITSFIRSSNFDDILLRILNLSDSGQLDFYNLLEKSLLARGVIEEISNG